MSANRPVTSISGALLAAAGLSGFLYAESPPKETVSRLTAEDYPTRDSAAEALYSWADEGGVEAKDWLVRTALEAEDPELLSQSAEVLRRLVISELARERPGFVGIVMWPVAIKDEDSEAFGVAVRKVYADSPAEKAGLDAGDVIVELNGDGWMSESAQDDFAEQVGKLGAGETISLAVIRNGKKETEEVEMTLAPRPWSAGEYRTQRETNDLLSRRFQTEEEAQREVFREWLGKFRAEQGR